MSNWTWNLDPVLKFSKDSRKLLPLHISINWPSLVGYWVVVQKIYSKMHPASCTNTYHDVTDLVNHRMVKNTKTWISLERNIMFLRNKKIPNLCLRWPLLRSYYFVVEVTFNYFWPFLVFELSVNYAFCRYSRNLIV